MPADAPAIANKGGLRDPLIRFLALAAALYGVWFLVYEFVIHPWGRLDRAVIDNLMILAGTLLTGLGYTLLPEPDIENYRTIGVQGGSDLWVGDPCNGVALFAVFLIFLISYPGAVKHKLWFGLLGVITIHLINALRIVVLSIVVTVDYELLNFQHDYTFYVVVYGWVFLLWYIWVKRFAPEKLATASLE